MENNKVDESKAIKQELVRTEINLELTSNDISQKCNSDIYTLTQKFKAMNERLKLFKGILDEGIKLKYSQEINPKRKDKQFGSVSLIIDDFKIVSTLPKRFEWDQKKLKKLYTELTNEGIDASRFIDVRFKVSEKVYNSCAKSLKDKMEDARIVKEGAEKIEILKGEENE